MTEDASPENLRKFLESDDPGLVMMGLSMAKGIELPEDLLELLVGISIWNQDSTIREASTDILNKYEPEILEGSENLTRTKKRLRALYLLNDADVVREFYKWGEFAIEPLTEILGPWGTRFAILEAIIVYPGEEVRLYNIVRVLKNNALNVLTRILKQCKIRVSYHIAAIESIIRLLQREENQGREEAHNDPNYAKIICEKDTDEKWAEFEGEDMKVFALEALGKIGSKKSKMNELLLADTQVVETIINVFEDESYLWGTACTALQKIGDKRAIEPLIKILQNKGKAKYEAINALEKIDSKQAIEPLIKILQNKSEERNVRKYSIEMLARLWVTKKDERSWDDRRNLITKALKNATKYRTYSLKREAKGNLFLMAQNSANVGETLERWKNYLE